MQTALSVLHALVTLALVGSVLLQRSEGGGLVADNNAFAGIAGSRSVANFLTKLTSILAVMFFVLSIVLALLAKSQNNVLTPATFKPAERALDLRQLLGETESDKKNTTPQVPKSR